MMKHVALLLLVCTLAHSSGWSQVDTTLHISTVTITSTTKHHSTVSSKHWNSSALDSIRPSSMIDLLSHHGNIFIKNYGPSSIATASIRGASSSQLGVYWNDIPVQSPMLGTMDISLLPTTPDYNITLATGNQSSQHGSGSIGGSILLHNADLSTLPRIKASVGMASFGRVHGSGSWTSQLSKTIYHKVHVSHNTAKNNFPYYINEQKKILPHAALSATHVMDDIQWNITPKSQLSLRYWGAWSHKELPPRTVQNESKAKQKDASNRLSATYVHLGNLGVWRANVGYSSEQLLYTDAAIKLISDSHFHSMYSDVGYTRQSKKSSWRLKASHQYTTASIKSYGEVTPTEHRTALLLSYRSPRTVLPFEVDIRQEANNTTILYPVPSLKLYKEWKRHHIAANISRAYRHPTFNDRYWIPGGNPNILPESGWEASTSWQYTSVRHQWSAEYYSRWIKDWILWVPSKQSGYWSASNVAYVWSRGIEAKYRYSSQKINASCSYSYTLSTHQNAIKKPQINKGSQLWYTPIHSMNAGISYSIGNGHVAYTHRYVSETIGINKDLKGYHLGSMRGNYTFAHAGVKWNLYTTINNIWNTSYRVVEKRPMPLRNLSVGITITI